MLSEDVSGLLSPHHVLVVGLSNVLLEGMGESD